MSQPFDFAFSDNVIAQVAGVSQKDLHLDADIILCAYDALAPLAARLGVPAPLPQLAEFTYAHIAALGARFQFTDFEPTSSPLLTAPEEIDRLCEPDDYLAAELIQQRLRVAHEILRRRPDAPRFIGHLFEGPVTTAALILGQDFFMLPYEDPPRAHRLLQFSVTSAMNYARRLNDHFGGCEGAFAEGFPDDFAGILPPKLFGEFVVPYWEQVFQGLGSKVRFVHSELLRIGHLPFLKDLGIDCYDPSADQYLAPELLRDHCPTRFELRILNWHAANLSAPELQALYRRYATFHPVRINFSLSRLEDLPKIEALLETARELA
jgi:hypothetical protein